MEKEFLLRVEGGRRFDYVYSCITFLERKVYRVHDYFFND